MARIASAAGILKALGRASWRDVRSFRSIGGQNFFLFAAFVALQPSSAEFFVVLLLAVMFFPLSADPMRKIPAERRLIWPISEWEWMIVRAGSYLLSPIVWIAAAFLLRAGWRAGAIVLFTGVLLQYIAKATRRLTRMRPNGWLQSIPAPPGLLGSLMRLHWREMLQTLDPYMALLLMVSTLIYRYSGMPVDPAALHILTLIVVLALSTETQVLLGLDGPGAERYRQMPIRGWQILLAKDLAFLGIACLLVLPLDLVSGLAASVISLAIGHHRSVLTPLPQLRWRFTEGALFPDRVIQIVFLFSAGMAVRTEGPQVAVACVAAWLVSLWFYGWRWDRRRFG